VYPARALKAAKIVRAPTLLAGVEAAARALARFVEPAKFSGLVARALACHGIEGATVAPAA